jgi:hypothetical protein
MGFGVGAAKANIAVNYCGLSRRFSRRSGHSLSADKCSSLVGGHVAVYAVQIEAHALQWTSSCSGRCERKLGTGTSNPYPSI